MYIQTYIYTEYIQRFHFAPRMAKSVKKRVQLFNWSWSLGHKVVAVTLDARPDRTTTITTKRLKTSLEICKSGGQTTITTTANETADVRCFPRTIITTTRLGATATTTTTMTTKAHEHLCGARRNLSNALVDRNRKILMHEYYNNKSTTIK